MQESVTFPCGVTFLSRGHVNVTTDRKETLHSRRVLRGSVTSTPCLSPAHGKTPRLSVIKKISKAEGSVPLLFLLSFFHHLLFSFLPLYFKSEGDKPKKTLERIRKRSLREWRIVSALYKKKTPFPVNSPSSLKRSCFPADVLNNGSAASVGWLKKAIMILKRLLTFRTSNYLVTRTNITLSAKKKKKCKWPPSLWLDEVVWKTNQQNTKQYTSVS